ncbi:MAG TPA: hypothetical protein ENN03_03465 [bacterium]|nr:hypothetical protein [bacterium]
MSAQPLGRVQSGRTRKSYEVKWNQSNRDVYISYAGWSYAGKASSAGEAMNRAEAWLYDK